jgi:hypothetical protein
MLTYIGFVDVNARNSDQGLDDLGVTIIGCPPQWCLAVIL